jgi:hypothetical protein
LDLDEEKKQGCNWDAENNIRTNFGHRWLLHKLAEGRVTWTKLMHILKNNGIDWRERRLISKLYTDQSVKIRLDQGESISVKIERGVRKGCHISSIIFNLYSEHLTKGALEGFRDFKTGQVIRTVKYAGNLVLLPKEERILQGKL